MAQQKYPKYSKPRQALAQFIHATCSMGRVSEDGVGRFCSFLLMATEFFICQFYAVERQLASYSPQITEKQRSGRGGKVLNKISQSMTRKPPFAKRHAPSYLPTYNVSLEDLFFLQIIVLGGAERGREELGLIGQWIISIPSPLAPNPSQHQSVFQ